MEKYENRLRGVDIKLALPSEVDSLMFNLIMDWNETENPTIEDIAKFHYKFEMIHPFKMAMVGLEDSLFLNNVLKVILI